jgi:large repetitive protein
MLPGPLGEWEEVTGPPPGDAAPVKLADGSVLLIGGYGTDQVLKFLPASNTVMTMNPLPEQRGRLAACALADGRVLVVGGDSPTAQDGMTTSLLYDAGSDSWTPTAELPASRAEQAAIRLPGGDVVVFGGVGPGVVGTPVGDVYRFVVADEAWETLAPSPVAAQFHTLFLLDDQTLFVAAENSIVYSLGSESVTATPSLSVPRQYAEPVQLATGAVLAIGGAPLGVLGSDDMAFTTVDQFVKGTPTYAPRASLGVPRARVGAVTLTDGTVLAAGGNAFQGEEDPAAQTAERYVPAVDAWYPEAPPPIPTGGQATLLDDGSVFFVTGARFHPKAWQ